MPSEANERAYQKLYRHRSYIDLVFNLSEGIYGQAREAQLPAMLEMLQLPYTGSDPLTQALVLDKAKAKEILIANNVPTPPFQVMKTGDEPLKKNLDFPLFVKPVAEGSSAGITNDSKVDDEEALRRKAKEVIALFNDYALVEPYLEGKEYSVPMLGNPPKCLPIIEPDHSALPENLLPFDSLEVKWQFEEDGNEDYLVCPARVGDDMKQKIEKLCQDCWKALRIRDWCRVDLRCDKTGEPYILEINSPAGIIPPEVSKTSYFPVSARTAGMEYEDMLKTIITVALDRVAK
jgi:D-alanine-D-alanine ligase